MRMCVTACMVLLAIDINANTSYVPISFHHGFCSFPSTPTIVKVSWLPPIAFDIYSGFLLCLNALDRPRGMDENIMRLLVSDGIMSILFHLLSTICGLVFTVTTAPGLWVFAFPIAYNFVLIVHSRKFLNITEIVSKSRRTDNYGVNLMLRPFKELV